MGNRKTNKVSSIKNTLVSIVILLLGALLFSITAAAAQTDDELDEQNEILAQQRIEIEARNLEVQNQIATNQLSVAQLTETLESIDLEVNQISAQVSAEEAKLTTAQREITELEEQSEIRRAEIKVLEDRIRDQAISGYQIGDGAESEGSDPAAQARAQEILSTVTSTQAEDISRLNDLVTQLEQEQIRATILEVRVEQSKALLETDRQELELAQASQQEVVDQAEAVLEARLAEAAVLADRDSDLAAQIEENTQELAERAAARSATTSSSRSTVDIPGVGEIVNVQGISVHVSIADDLDRLLTDARADGINLAGWGYRDPQRQIELRQKHCGTSHFEVYEMSSSQCSPPTARPGSSQHERGLAIDFTLNGGSIGSRYNSGFKWLDANAHRYGLKNLPSEPWHWSTTGR